VQVVFRTDQVLQQGGDLAVNHGNHDNDSELESDEEDQFESVDTAETRDDDDVELDILGDVTDDGDSEDDEFSEIEEDGVLSKDQNARSLEVRRAIEARMEERRLQEDLDYLDLDP